MAKRTGAARSGAVKKSAKAARAKKATRAGVRRRAAGRSAKKAGAAKKTSRKLATRTARRKTAARAAASRTTRRTARPRPSPPASSTVKKVASKVRGVVAAVVQRVAGARPWAADENDPIALLETDHRRFEDLMKQGEDTTERAVKGRTELLDTLTAELNVHEMIEEKVLYPALKPHSEARDIVLEGFQEHHVADILVKELHHLSKDDEQWGAKFKVLSESLEHHIKEEEQKMFPTARQVLSPDDLKALGARMRELKAEAERGN